MIKEKTLKDKTYEWIDSNTWGLLQSITKKHPSSERWVIPGVGVVVVLLIVVGYFAGVKPLFPNAEPNKPKQELGQETTDKNSISDDEIEKNRVSNQCEGSQFDIIGKYLDPVGGETFTKEEAGWSTKDSKNYQAAVETKWGCAMPFQVTVVATPISGKSFGLYVEYLNMFKILVGDGDRKTLRVEENKWGSRSGEWPVVPDFSNKKRPTLLNPIEDGEEVTLTIKAKEEAGIVLLHIDIYHSKLQSHEPFDFEIVPNAVNFQTDQLRRFRIGINDWRFKGEGSVINLQTLSIKEEQW